MRTMAKELIMLADILDASGFHKEAEEVDEAARNFKVNSSAIDPFVDAVKTALTAAMEGGHVNGLDENVLQHVFKSIDTVVDRGGWTEYKMGPEEFEEWKSGQEPPISKVKHLWTLEDDIKKLEHAKRQTEDPEQWRRLDLQIDADRKQMDEIHQLVRKWYEGRREGDKENYEKFLQTYSDPNRPDVSYDFAHMLGEKEEGPPRE